jgi:hypothetical protein
MDELNLSRLNVAIRLTTWELPQKSRQIFFQHLHIRSTHKPDFSFADRRAPQISGKFSAKNRGKSCGDRRATHG